MASTTAEVYIRQQTVGTDADPDSFGGDEILPDEQPRSVFLDVSIRGES